MLRLECLGGLTVPACAALLLVVGCATSAPGPLPTPVSMATYRAHVATLASDDFGGRKPGSSGEQKTLDYLVAEFQRLGLEPGNGDSFLQPVPMVEITAASDAALQFTTGKTTTVLEYGKDMVIWTKRVREREGIESSPLVFVGYGITAPEYGWDDYAGLDVRGKTVVMFVNDPGFATGDPKLFRGRTMTYYGRWTYKYEEAAKHGAAAAIIVHETEPAAYGWETVVNSWTGPQLDMASTDGNAGRVAIEGWITEAAAEHLFMANGGSLAAAKERAKTRGFRPQALQTQATAAVRNSVRRANSQNVVARLPGSERPDEHVLYMAHWDHLGQMIGRGGDAIFNGAVDNATGTAGLLALAEAFSKAPARPKRSLLFLAVTLEESGLLGSAYYVDNPVAPLASTVAVINMDAMPFGGPTRDVTVIGAGASELEDVLALYAKRQDRVLRNEPTPEKGFFYRSDHFNFAKRGVPALYVKLGIDDRERGEAWGIAQAAEYIEQRYHKVDDEYRPDTDLRGTWEDLNLLYAVGAELAADSRYPNWYPDNEFRAIRDRSRATMSQ